MRLNLMLYVDCLTCFMLCCSVNGPHCFKRSKCLHLQHQTVTENEGTTLGSTHQTTQRYIPEDLIRQEHHCSNLKSHIMQSVFKLLQHYKASVHF